MGFDSSDSATDTSLTLQPGSWNSGNADQLFQRCMVDNLREGVIYVDRFFKVTVWNRAAEAMTGIRGAAVLNQRWLPSLINLKDRYDKAIADKLCPVNECVRKAEAVTVASTVTGQGGKQIAIDFKAIPVIGHDRSIYGAVIIMNDLSAQVDLEQQVLTLYAHATRDQLTGVSNRAHFERSIEARIKEFHAKGMVSSLIVADIDFFKKINDDFGHHVGDHALMNFAKILQQNVRVHDLVARYGGEEFVILCPECPLEIAVERAEEIRAALTQTPITSLNGRCLTASFGVTEFEADDSAISAFVRADQALLNAKENGRNQVQSLQTAKQETRAEETGGRDPSNTLDWRELKGTILQQFEGESISPMEILVEKIKGFVSDNKASIVFAEPDHVRIKLAKAQGLRLRRAFDRQTPLFIDLECRSNYPSVKDRTPCTRLRVSIRPVNSRDRRHRDLASRVEYVLRDFVERIGAKAIPAEPRLSDSGR